MKAIVCRISEDLFQIRVRSQVLVLLRQGAMVLCYNVTIHTMDMLPVCIHVDICQTEVDARNHLLTVLGVYCATECDLETDCLEVQSALIKDRANILILRIWRVSNIPVNEIKPHIFIPQEPMKIDSIYYMPDRVNYTIMTGDNDTVLAFSKVDDSDKLYDYHRVFLKTNSELSIYEGRIERENKHWVIRQDRSPINECKCD